MEQSLTQHIESLEIECQFLRTLVLPRPIQCLSINQGSAPSRHGNSKDGQGELRVASMDLEEDSLQQDLMKALLRWRERTKTVMIKLEEKGCQDTGHSNAGLEEEPYFRVMLATFVMMESLK